MSAVNEAEKYLSDYLSSFSTDGDWIEAVAKRTECPGCRDTSKSLYCERCLQLVVSRQYWPTAKPQELPFALDIIVDDRITSATGVHFKVLWNALCSKNDCGQEVDDKKCRLFNYDRGEGEQPPDYDDEEGTYLLFPSEDSIPMSSIKPTSKIRRIVVLDCKWARSAVRLHPSITRLPKVHLDNSPKHSQYWRWHNAGEGMLCTIEAIYYTACHFIPPADAVHSMWLFAVQKAIIQHKHAAGKVSMPRSRPYMPKNTVSLEMKDYVRSLRKQNTAKQKRNTTEQKRNAKNSGHRIG